MEERVPYGSDRAAVPPAPGERPEGDIAPLNRLKAGVGDLPNVWGKNASQAAWEWALWRSGKTRKEVAAACGVLPAAVSGWIRGTAVPTGRALKQAADLLGTSPADLLAWHDMPEINVGGLVGEALEHAPGCAQAGLSTDQARLDAISGLVRVCTRPAPTMTADRSADDIVSEWTIWDAKEELLGVLAAVLGQLAAYEIAIRQEVVDKAAMLAYVEKQVNGLCEGDKAIMDELCKKNKEGGV